MIGPQRLPLTLVLVVGTVMPGNAAGIDPDTAFLSSLVSNLEAVAEKVIPLAEAIPADKYSWNPTPGVRSVSQVLMHIVGGNFQLPPGLGAVPPDSVDMSDYSVWGLKQQRRGWEADVVAKDAVVGMLKQSFDYALHSIPTIANLDEQVSIWGFPESKRDYLLLLVTHAHEHLGQTISYARSLKITPPWSRQSAPVRVASTATLGDGVARGEITSLDRFGNLTTNLVDADLEFLNLETGDEIEFEACGVKTEMLLGNELFDVRPSEWVAFISRDGTLTVAQSFANAASELGCVAGGPISLSRAED